VNDYNIRQLQPLKNFLVLLKQVFAYRHYHSILESALRHVSVDHDRDEGFPVSWIQLEVRD
jgi:hypothetical protein